MIKAVIFDIDGVLVNSFNANLKFFQEVFKTAGYSAPTKKHYKKAFHLTTAETIRLFSKTNSEAEFGRIWSIADTVRRPVELFKLPKNSKETIKKLSKKYKLALVTSRIKKGVADYLKFSNTASYFKTIIHFGHYKKPKPNPEPLLIAVKKLKVLSSEALYVGDAATDIQAAKAAGMKIILYSKKKMRGADYTTYSFKKMPSIIERISQNENRD